MAPTAVNMIGGEGPSSYDRNSVFQGETLRLLGAPLLETAVRHWLKLQQASSGKGPLGTAPIMVADLGCSTGKNSVMHMQRVEQWLRLDDTERAALEGGGSDKPTVLAFFSDLPDNDWSSLLRRIHAACRSSEEGGQRQLSSYVAAVPGSFYDRLFANSFLDIITSNYALQFLSRVPLEAAEPEWNPGRIWCSPGAEESVLKAYQRQGAQDLRTFFVHRAAELRPGGLLWTFFPAWEEDGRCKTDMWLWTVEDAWRELTQEGQLESHYLDNFNVPVYYPTLSDIQEAVKDSGAYEVHTLSYVYGRDIVQAEPSLTERESGGTTEVASPTAGQIWAVFHSQVCGLMGAERSDLLYKRIQETIAKDPEKAPIGDFTLLCGAFFRK